MSVVRWLRRAAPVLLASSLLCACTQEDSEQFIKGMSYAGYSPNVFAGAVSDGLIRHLATTGTNWLIVIPQWYQDNMDSTDIEPWAERTPTDKSVRHLVRLAHELGLQVMLKPFVDPKVPGWRARFEPSDWAAWFRSYTRFIDHYASLAAEEHCEGLSVGVEYSTSDAAQPARWRAVIRSVRARFRGLLTYSADWPQYRKVRFWDALDAIGIDAYFPLSRTSDPSLAALRLGWLPWMHQITSFLRAYPTKRVIFTEIGYTSRPGAAIDPSQYSGSAPADPGLQARLYQSVFDTVYHEPWLMGLCFFWWDNPSVPDYPAGPADVGFTPRGKPAETVLRRSFRGPRTVLVHPF